ncbi:MAG: hypothetical protein E7130_03335 [Rikenellaceae bacterium]|nr:hypothetical protein [Rikenellaceae bacterium]MBQ7342100.1 hypothetical protein [Alistipes sp.]
MYHDTDFNPNREREEQEAAEREALARTIRREVLRVNSGEADEEIRAEREQMEAERQAREAEEEKSRRRNASLWRQMFSGRILVHDTVRENYRYIAIIAAMFLLSIAVLFWTLSLDITFARLDSEVQLLHERSIRLQEECYRHSSHSAIVERMQERDMKLYDPLRPNEVIE